jgi:hypothetical protein
MNKMRPIVKRNMSSYDPLSPATPATAAPMVTLKNSGLQSYMVTSADSPSSDPITVKPFTSAQIQVPSNFKPLYVHFQDGFSTAVVFNSAGAVISPTWVNQFSNGMFLKTKSMNTQALRASTSAPFELRVFTMWFGVPWFCWVSTIVALALIAIMIAVMATHASKRRKSRK